MNDVNTVSNLKYVNNTYFNNSVKVSDRYVTVFIL